MCGVTIKVASLPAATKLGQGNVFTGICLSTGEEGCLPQYMLGYTPRTRYSPPAADPAGPGRHPPGPGRPPGPGTSPPCPGPGRPPRTRHPPGSRLQHTVNERPVRILLECILVIKVFTPIYKYGFD